MYIFETSWEVCNRVGGIYTVLSSRARLMQDRYKDQVFFFGPELGEQSNVFFREQKSLLRDWQQQAKQQGLRLRVGRWQVPGKPIAILVDYTDLWAKKNEIYGWAWEKFGVQSHAAYGDYDDSSLFGYAVGQAMQSLHDFLSSTPIPTTYDPLPTTSIAHFNEWQTAFGLFYIKAHCPEVGTVFTTHATGIGRSIAGNGKPLYDYLQGYDGSQMAQELNMVSKHSAERQAAHAADCFTTVSDITARECTQLLERQPDVVTENGFEPDFVPKAKQFGTARQKARKALLQVAEQQTGKHYTDDTLICCISGRQEWKNKGIDVFLEAMEQLGSQMPSDKHLVAFSLIPYLDQPPRLSQGVDVVFCPHYLNGNDDMFGLTYYDLLIGMDFTVFPSYYEPWGYTPLESVAFHVPTITTDLAGFGKWAETKVKDPTMASAVFVLHRTDTNRQEVVNKIVATVQQLAAMNFFETEKLREQAALIASQATWEHFFPKYEMAYEIALKKKKL